MKSERKNLGDLAAALKRRKWSIVLPAVAIFLLTAAAAFLAPPVYQSTSTIFIEEQEVPKDIVMSGLESFSEQKLQTVSRRIMTAARLSDIIDRFSLYPDLRGKRTKDEIVDRMRTKDIRLKTVSVDVMQRRTGKAVATIAFTLSFRGKDPAKVQQVANALALLYLEQNAGPGATKEGNGNIQDEIISTEAATEKRQTAARFALIEPARLPQKPVVPNIPVMIAIGLGLGLAVGLGAAAFREFNDTSVRSAEELTRETAFPVLASIPEIVVPDPKLESRRKVFTNLIGIAVALIIGLLVFHFEFMELDELWARLTKGIAD
jgi:uncharacterized protein involved in exopolysaccharide biosynthesis